MSTLVVGVVIALIVVIVSRLRRKQPPKQHLPTYGPHIIAKALSQAGDIHTIGQLFRARVQVKPAAPAFYEKENGLWVVTTWAQFYESASKVAHFITNVQKLPLGTTVCILGPTKPKWCILDMAIQLSGCVSVGIYPHQSADQYKYIIEHCEAPLVFVDSYEELEKVMEAIQDLPNVKSVVTWDAATATKYTASHGANDIVIPFNVAHKESLDEVTIKKRTELTTPGQVAMLVYTSGTTGPPKGVMLSHRNILSMLAAASARREEIYQDDTVLSFLPMAHVAEKILGFYARIDIGYTNAFASSIPAVLSELQETQPTVFGSVPRIFEKAYAKVFSELDKKPAIVRKLFAWATKIAAARTRLYLDNKPIPLLLSLQYRLAYKIFAPVRKAFGGRVKFMVVGAAPIDLKILEFFWGAGIPVYEVYGMTESTAVSHLNSHRATRLQTVGRVIPGATCKIAEDGEILIKALSVFEGYLKNEEATKEAIDSDGWLHTGDIGTVDKDGFLKITDRKKHLIITAGGKNLSPANIENAIKNKDFLISQVHAHGDKRPFVCALIAPSPVETMEFGVQHGLIDKDTCKALEKELLSNPVLRSEAVNKETAKVVTHPEYIARIRAAIVAGNVGLGQVEKVKKFIILDRDFSQEHGELTASMKMKRRDIEKKFAHMFDKVYSTPKYAVDVYDSPIGGE